MRSVLTPVVGRSMTSVMRLASSVQVASMSRRRARARPGGTRCGASSRARGSFRFQHPGPVRRRARQRWSWRRGRPRRSACPSRVECLPCQGERSGCGNDSPPSPRPDGARRRSCAAACSSLSVSCRCFCRPMGVLGRVFEMVTVVILTPRRELMGYDRNRRSHDGLPSTRLWTIRRRGYSGRHSRAIQQREDIVKVACLPVILQRKIGLRNTTCDFRAIEWAHSFWRNRLWARN